VFAEPPTVQTEIFTRLPEEYRVGDKESAWTRARGSGPMHSFLEGRPSIVRAICTAWIWLTGASSALHRMADGICSRTMTASQTV
jgi:hypothetical protein